MFLNSSTLLFAALVIVGAICILFHNLRSQFVFTSNLSAHVGSLKRRITDLEKEVMSNRQTPDSNIDFLMSQLEQEESGNGEEAVTRITDMLAGIQEEEHSHTLPVIEEEPEEFQIEEPVPNIEEEVSEEFQIDEPLPNIQEEHSIEQAVVDETPASDVPIDVSPVPKKRGRKKKSDITI